MNADLAILRRLHRADGRPVTAAELADAAGTDRDGVAARLAELQSAGFAFDTDGDGAIRLTSPPPRLVGDDIEARLGDDRRIGRPVRVFDRTDSTNDLAMRLGGQGHPEGLVLFAESQRRGRGRFGRTWHSPAGTGLWFSALVRPDLPAAHAARLTIAAAVAVAEGIAAAAEVEVRIKWPNDVRIGRRKVAGILVETATDGGLIAYATIGIGINVDLPVETTPAELRGRITSVAGESAREVERHALAAEVLRRLDACVADTADRGFARLRDRFAGLCETLGTEVIVRDGDGGIHGVAEEIADDGALMVRTTDGALRPVRGGETFAEQFDPVAAAETTPSAETD